MTYWGAEGREKPKADFDYYNILRFGHPEGTDTVFLSTDPIAFFKDGIAGSVEGKTRTLVTTWPEGIVKPMFALDEKRYFAGWADDSSISKGQAAPQFAVAFGVLDGKHTVKISEWTFPPLPTTPERRALELH